MTDWDATWLFVSGFAFGWAICWVIFVERVR